MLHDFAPGPPDRVKFTLMPFNQLVVFIQFSRDIPRIRLFERIADFRQYFPKALPYRINSCCIAVRRAIASSTGL
jgi:hypothetical protein